MRSDRDPLGSQFDGNAFLRELGKGLKHLPESTKKELRDSFNHHWNANLAAALSSTASTYSALQAVPVVASVSGLENNKVTAGSDDITNAKSSTSTPSVTPKEESKPSATASRRNSRS